MPVKSVKTAQPVVPQLPEEKQKALSLAIAQIEKTVGRGSIMRMGQDSARVLVGSISTGAINLDAAIGVGGVPRGRITEVAWHSFLQIQKRKNAFCCRQA